MKMEVIDIHDLVRDVNIQYGLDLDVPDMVEILFGDQFINDDCYMRYRVPMETTFDDSLFDCVYAYLDYAYGDDAKNLLIHCYF